jgi:hypothetical protein
MRHSRQQWRARQRLSGRTFARGRRVCPTWPHREEKWACFSPSSGMARCERAIAWWRCAGADDDQATAMNDDRWPVGSKEW